MMELDLLLPFGLAPEELARDLLREMCTPALSVLLARSRRTHYQTIDGFSRALPHEIHLAQRFGLAASAEASPGIAAALMQHFNLPATAGAWFILQPVHLHIARDHLVLTDPRQLSLPDDDARALFAAVQPLFEEAGSSLLYGDAQTWVVHRDEWAELRTSTPDAAIGHNIDIWMPKGANERDWRRMQNEVQMHWHTHAVNDARDRHGHKPVNSLWLWGGASATALPQGPYDAHFVVPGSTSPYRMLGAAKAASSAIGIIQAQPRHALLVLDELVGLALAGAWAEWLACMQRYETLWFAPLLAALQAGELDRINLTLSHDRALRTYTVSKSSLRAFWRKPSLARLTP